MPLFEIPLTIISLEDQPSVGSVITDIDVADFINACSDEEFDDLVQRIRVIAAENDGIGQLAGLRQLTEEEVKELGLPSKPEDKDIEVTKLDVVKDSTRKRINRTKKKK
jgi:hypothetical protein